MELNSTLCVSSQELPDWRLVAPPEMEDTRPNMFTFGLLPLSPETAVSYHMVIVVA